MEGIYKTREVCNTLFNGRSRDKCKHFEEGIRTTIQVPVTASANWLNFSKMVEATMRVENTLVGEKKSFKKKRSGMEMNKGKGSGEG